MKIIVKKYRLFLGLLAIPALAVFTITSEPEAINWQDMIKHGDSVLKGYGTPQNSQNGLTTMSNDKVIQGLKEALTTGVGKAIKMLGSRDGFLNDETVRIIMPERLQKADQMLRALGQERIIDEFITSMNRAAEQAVPEVIDIFTDSILNMSITDAIDILNGGDTAATEFFRRTTSDELTVLIRPHVKKAMDSNRVTQNYSSLVKQAKSYDRFGLIGTYLGDAAEIEDYVTGKTMAGLFNKIAGQEKLIRQNPAARSSELLQEVFGYQKAETR